MNLMKHIESGAKWDRRFVNLARHVAEEWSKDPSTKVGAVLVSPDRYIVIPGINGFPRGIADDHRLHDRAQKYPRIIHAEKNAILNCPQRPAGWDLYTWPFQPCSDCALMIIQSGIRRVVAPEATDDRWFTSFMLACELFQEAGVELELLI